MFCTFTQQPPLQQALHLFWKLKTQQIKTQLSQYEGTLMFCSTLSQRAFEPKL